MLATIVVQAMVLIRVHRRQPGYKVGVIDPSLGQESLFFRAHRTFWNSMENIVPLFGTSVLAILAGYDASRLAVIVWIYALARIVHMILYYRIATEKNPSPRSYFFIIGVFASAYLLVDVGRHLVGMALAG
ncbi:MAG: MAPEG family protein [Alphaproteobacteria bacterium]|nr:MAPEG family protein [Alphaproteobacteria bacterium]